MHHFPRLFTRKSRTEYGMDSTRNPRRRPKLERRNAAKDIYYEAASSSDDTTTATPAITTSSSASNSLVTRSLELLLDRTSIRIEGKEEGEFDRICRSLGLSGIDDFSIPTAQWEAMKVRSSSDVLPRSRLKGLDSPRVMEEVNFGVVKEEAEVVKLGDDSVGVRVSDAATELTRDEPESTNKLGAVVGRVDGTRGIKGVRPPPVLKPPPAMTLPAVNHTGSTWDLVMDFAPESERGPIVHMGFVSDEDEEEGHGGEDRGVVNGPVFYESYSFTTSNDDDTSSTTSNISPNGRIRSMITDWEKGRLLGSGSFGSVYEGIAKYVLEPTSLYSLKSFCKCYCWG